MQQSELHLVQGISGGLRGEVDSQSVSRVAGDFLRRGEENAGGAGAFRSEDAGEQGVSGKCGKSYPYVSFVVPGQPVGKGRPRFPTTKPDIDNVIKGLFDACNSIVWLDDKQVVDLRVRKRYAERAEAIMTVYPL